MLLKVDKLTKTFQMNRRALQAVREVSFSIETGQTLGLVGESGCGKSTLGRTLIKLYEPTAGQIVFNGQDITHFSVRKMKDVRRHMQMIFQDPFASLNPRMNIGDIVTEPLIVHQIGDSAARKKRMEQLLDLVNLPKNCAGRFPHEFSGGQRQRVGIARALALSPKLVICDEPISALDVSIQAQIANLLLALQKELQLTYLFIAHDLAMVKVLSTHVAVMYLGEFVEIGPVEAIYSQPSHPYTQILLNSIPLHDPVREKKRAQIFLKGEVPSPFVSQRGCPFASRCPLAQGICFEQKPPLKALSPAHKSACFFAQELHNQGLQKNPLREASLTTI